MLLGQEIQHAKACSLFGRIVVDFSAVVDSNVCNREILIAAFVIYRLIYVIKACPVTGYQFNINAAAFVSGIVVMHFYAFTHSEEGALSFVGCHGSRVWENKNTATATIAVQIVNQHH